MGRSTAILIAAVLVGAGAGATEAAAFTVDSTADAPDAALDGSCDAGGGDCTLRGAIEEANFLAGRQAIEFAPAVFDGTMPGSRIVLASELPTITGAVDISGGNCTVTTPLPCVELLGDGTFTGLAFIGVSNRSSVRGLRIAGMEEGIIVSGPPDTAVPVTIGDDDPALANELVSNAGDAIEVIRVDGVEVRGNRVSGTSRAIDLELPSGPGNFTSLGANQGIQAPVMGVTSSTALWGSGEPLATIRVFAQPSFSPGELGPLISMTSAGPDGSWVATYPPQPQGSLLVATQTIPGPRQSGQTSEPSAIAQLGSFPPPEITLTQAPPARVKATKKKKKVVHVTFSFAGTGHVPTDSSVRFECSIDGGPFLPCVSPESLRLSKGPHAFRVRSRDSAGVAGAAAEHNFTVVRKKKKKKRD